MQGDMTVAAMCLVAVAASAYDITQQRIPNAITVTAFVAALALRAPDGLSSVGLGLLGAAICFVLALPFFLVGGAGGGDVKLLTAFGAFLGPARLPVALLGMAMFGGLMAVVAILRHGSIQEVGANLKTILVTFGRKSFSGWKDESNAPLTIHSPEALTVPYGVAISAGALAGWFLA